MWRAVVLTITNLLVNTKRNSFEVQGEIAFLDTVPANAQDFLAFRCDHHLGYVHAAYTSDWYIQRYFRLLKHPHKDIINTSVGKKVVKNGTENLPMWVSTMEWSLSGRAQRCHDTNSWTEDRFDWIRLSVGRAPTGRTAIEYHPWSTKMFKKIICFIMILVIMTETILKWTTYGNHKHIRVWFPFHNTINTMFGYRLRCSFGYDNRYAGLYGRIDKDKLLLCYNILSRSTNRYVMCALECFWCVVDSTRNIAKSCMSPRSHTQDDKCRALQFTRIALK